MIYNFCSFPVTICSSKDQTIKLTIEPHEVQLVGKLMEPETETIVFKGIELELKRRQTFVLTTHYDDMPKFQEEDIILVPEKFLLHIVEWYTESYYHHPFIVGVECDTIKSLEYM